MQRTRWLVLLGAMAAGLACAQAPRPAAKDKDKPPAKVVAPAGPRVWLAREVAQISEQQVWLFGADGSSVGVARTEQLRALLSVFGKLEHQAGVSSELYLSEGPEPDTWLAPGKGDQIVIRISLGLVTMIGNDWDAWAFVLGHQLAHIEMFTRQRSELEQREVGLPPPQKLTQDEEEKVADGLALDWTIKAGYKPDGAVLFLTRLASRATPSSLFMRRHPFYPGRLDYVRDLGVTLTVPVKR
ncbi:MAG TPA: hypothetical protein VG873_11445 [Burkholderiales bacterium]|nr:hypothetical protein [Burkholderiales bacterium]